MPPTHGPPVGAAEITREQDALAGKKRCAIIRIAERFPIQHLQLRRAGADEKPQPQCQIAGVGDGAGLGEGGAQLALREQAFGEQAPEGFDVELLPANGLEIDLAYRKPRAHPCLGVAIRPADAKFDGVCLRFAPVQPELQFDDFHTLHSPFGISTRGPFCFLRPLPFASSL